MPPMASRGRRFKSCPRYKAATGRSPSPTSRDRQVAFADGLDEPDALVAGDEQVLGSDRPLAARGVDVGVAQPAGLDADEDLAGTGRGIGTSRISSGAPSVGTTAAFMTSSC